MNGDTTAPLSALDVTFEKFTEGLGLSQDIKKRSWDNWNEFSSKHNEVQNGVPKTEWYACMVYMAIADTRMPYGPGDPHLQSIGLGTPAVTVTELLKKAQFSVVSFFKRMMTVREAMSLSESVKHSLTSLEKKYCIVSPLYHRFEKETKSVFRDDQKGDVVDGDCSVPFSHSENTDYRKKLCWSLFLHTKESLLSDNQELIHAYHLLLCCVEFVLRTTPSFQLQQPFDMLRLKSTENLDQNGLNVAVLQRLADQFQTNVDELYAIQTQTESFFLSLPHAGGELDVLQLQQLYQTAYRKSGDIDELLFLQCDPHLLPDHNRVSSGTSLLCVDTPITPVRAALNTVQQLKNILINTKDEPSLALKEHFENCSVNPSKRITSRVTELKQSFVDGYTAVVGPNQHPVASQRYQLAVRLYYRVMQAMLQSERERLSQSDFSNLLNNEAFHRSLLACAVEIVLMTYGVSWNMANATLESGESSKFAFPWVLQVFDLKAYDFYKVLESFIKEEPNLTREIVQHLQAIENRILDSIAWKEDSPLFEALNRCNTIQSGFVSPSKDQSNGPASTSADLYLSPMRHTRSRGSSPGTAVFPSPRKSHSSPVLNSPSKMAAPKRSQSLNMFFNKVCRLGYHRLKQLCDRLNVSKDLQQKIWTCFECCITCKPELLKNRHLDQIMLCSLYGICKVVESEIKFKTIVQVYRELPQAQMEVYKEALIEGREYDSIIAFYNKVFMQNLKTFMLQFAVTKPVQPGLSPVPKPVNSPLTASPVFTLPGRRHFYVSPLRESPFKAPQSPTQMTPRSRQLYSFGEGLGSSEKLRNINESVSAFRTKNSSHTPRGLKRLDFGDPSQNSTESPEKSDIGPTIIIKKQKVIPPPALRNGDPQEHTSSSKDTSEDDTSSMS